MNNGLKLAISLIIDVAGLASYLIPVWGEASDVVFFIVEGMWIWLAYKNVKLAFLGGLEEFIPLTDFIPACSIAHYFHTRKKRTTVA
jgi:hypothetical protein